MTHLTRDRIGKVFLFQQLIYLVTDCRLQTKSMKTYHNTPIWNSKLSEKMWHLYLPDRGDDAHIAYASPNALTDVSDLPSCYIEVAEYDCLRDEGMEYAKKLEAGGVETVLRETKGTIHGFEMNYDCNYTRDIVTERIEYAKAKFYGS